MGCTNGKDASAKRSNDTAQFQGNTPQVPPTAAEAVDAAKAAKAAMSGPPASAALEVAGDGPGGLNVLNADKMDLKDLVEKEPFHSVYTLGETLGRGNYSVVRKGVRKGTTEVYAIKCIKEASLTHEDREALKVETAILKGMDSPHIIKLYGFYEEPKEKMYYIVTEFVGGGELFDRIIAKEFYSEEDAQNLVRTIAKAIKYCHDRGVVHRDLKPENILLTSKDDDESIKIADFGFAKQYDTSSDDALSTSCGTPGYVAPEILNGKKYGREVDMWSFGVIIYILLCGYPPFHHENQKELFSQIRNAKFQFDEEYWSAVSESAKDLIRKLLLVNGAQRLTIDQLLDHEWLKAQVTGKLVSVQPGLQNMLNKRRLKAGINAVIAQNRMKKLLQGTVEAASQLAADDDVSGGDKAGEVADTSDCAPSEENGAGEDKAAPAPAPAPDAVVPPPAPVDAPAAASTPVNAPAPAPTPAYMSAPALSPVDAPAPSHTSVYVSAPASSHTPVYESAPASSHTHASSNYHDAPSASGHSTDSVSYSD